MTPVYIGRLYKQYTLVTIGDYIAEVRVIPGIAVGAFVNDRKSGRFLHAQNFTGMTLEEAVAKAELVEANPYVI
jgi:hypothetical protein